MLRRGQGLQGLQLCAHKRRMLLCERMCNGEGQYNFPELPRSSGRRTL